RLGEHVQQLHDARDIMAVGNDRITGVPLDHPCPDAADRVVAVHRVCAGQRHHRVRDIPYREIDDPIDQHRQVLGERTGGGGLGDDVFQVVTGCGMFDVVDGLD